MRIWFFHSAWVAALFAYVSATNLGEGWLKGILLLASLICFGIGSIIMEIRNQGAKS